MSTLRPTLRDAQPGTPIVDAAKFTAMGVGVEGIPTYREFEAVNVEDARQLERDRAQLIDALENVTGLFARYGDFDAARALLSKLGAK